MYWNFDDLELRICGDEILRKTSRDFPIPYSDLKPLLKYMKRTMKRLNGIGLAAPQIGLNIRFFIFADENDMIFPAVNPEITGFSNSKNLIEEGCLSVPDVNAEILRPEEIEVRYFDLSGNLEQKQLSGMTARVFQHEFDHLNGVLFIDHLPADQRTRLMEKFRE